MAVAARATVKERVAAVQPRWVAWAGWLVSVVDKAVVQDAFPVAWDGNKVAWTTVHTCNLDAWDIMLVTR